MSVRLGSGKGLQIFVEDRSMNHGIFLFRPYAFQCPSLLFRFLLICQNVLAWNKRQLWKSH